MVSQVVTTKENHEEKWRAALVSIVVITQQSSFIADFREYWVGPHINHFSCCCDSIPGKCNIVVWISALPFYLKLFSIMTARVWGSWLYWISSQEAEKQMLVLARLPRSYLHFIQSIVKWTIPLQIYLPGKSHMSIS